MKAEEIDLKFDNDEEVLEYFDLSTLKRPGLEKSLIEIDFPQWMLNALEQEAMLLGVILQWKNERSPMACLVNLNRMNSYPVC